MFVFTVTGAHVDGVHRTVYGTFTSAEGDGDMTLDVTIHGLTRIIHHDIRLDAGGIGTQTPKVTVSGGTITAVFDDTMGKSGTFYLRGD